MTTQLPVGYDAPLGYAETLDREIAAEIADACGTCGGSGKVRVPVGSVSYPEACPSCDGQSAEPVRCYSCDEYVTGAPVRDAEEIAWVGEARARVWCSTVCREADAETYWTNRWSAA